MPALLVAGLVDPDAALVTTVTLPAFVALDDTWEVFFIWKFHKCNDD